jgi:hypothetical protein
MTNAGQRNKKIFIISGIIVVVLGVAYFMFTRYIGSPDLAKSLKQQLIDLVDKKSKGLYHLKIGSISIDGNTASGTVHQISLTVDSTKLDELKQQQKSPATIYSLTLEKLTLNNADIMAFISTKTARLNKVNVSSGTFTIERLRKDTGSASGRSPQKAIRESLNNTIDGIHIDTVHADNIDVVYKNIKKQSRTVKNVFLDLYQLAIDSVALNDESRIFLSKKMRLSIDSIRFPLAGNEYRLGARKCIIAAGDSSVTSIQDLYLHATNNSSLEKLAAAQNEQKDVFDVKIKEVMIGNVDLQAMLEDSSIQAKLVIINGPDIAVFNDKSKKLSTASKIGKYPHQLIMQLPFSIKIPDLLVQDGKVSYAEKNEQGNAIGKISFSKLNGKIGPLNKGFAGPATIKANFTAMFMNRSGMSAQFEFPVSKDGRFKASAQFSPFQVSQINEAALPLGNTKLKEGRVTHLSFNVNGNDHSATGTTTLNYTGLIIDVMKTDNEPGYQKNKLMSMVANTFILHGDNLPGDKNKDAYTITYQRVPTKSFFNLIWKTVFYGVKANTGIGAKGKDKERARIH